MATKGSEYAPTVTGEPGGESGPNGRAASGEPGVYVIAPPRRFSLIDCRELWRYRDLFLVLAWRDIVVRYKQTVLGVLWAILQPVVTMVVFTLVFNKMVGIQSGDGTPYPVFVYVGLALWQYFSGTLTNASNSLVTNAQLVQKVYFPRMIMPAAASATGLIDLTVALVVLAGLMAWYRFSPQLVGVVILPVLVLTAVLCATGLGLLLAALNVKYRDVRHALPFFIQTVMYVTPVIYPIQMLDAHPAAKTLLLWLNPMSGVLANARAGLLGHSHVDWGVVGISVSVSVIYFALGLWYFRSTEHYFADIA